jgi:hypothetical protein
MNCRAAPMASPSASAFAPSRRNEGSPRGEIREDSGSGQHGEFTKYRGSHFADCYVVKVRRVVAKDRQPVFVV